MGTNTAGAKQHKLTKAVIYARVSSTKQTIEGTGLESQITRCEQYAKARDYEVVRAFRDDISGGKIERPAMSEMLTFFAQPSQDAACRHYR